MQVALLPGASSEEPTSCTDKGRLWQGIGAVLALLAVVCVVALAASPGQFTAMALKEHGARNWTSVDRVQELMNEALPKRNEGAESQQLSDTVYDAVAEAPELAEEKPPSGDGTTCLEGVDALLRCVEKDGVFSTGGAIIVVLWHALCDPVHASITQVMLTLNSFNAFSRIETIVLASLGWVWHFCVRSQSDYGLDEKQRTTQERAQKDWDEVKSTVLGMGKEEIFNQMLVRWGYLLGVETTTCGVPDYLLMAWTRFLLAHMLPVCVFLWLAWHVPCSSWMDAVAKAWVGLHYLSYAFFVAGLFFTGKATIQWLCSFVLPRQCRYHLHLKDGRQVLQGLWDMSPGKSQCRACRMQAYSMLLLLFSAERQNATNVLVHSIGLKRGWQRRFSLLLRIALDAGLPLTVFGGSFLCEPPGLWTLIAAVQSLSALVGWVLILLAEHLWWRPR